MIRMVIASEAKQSIPLFDAAVDCFVGFTPRDGEAWSK
jgi:hypothetical protein